MYAHLILYDMITGIAHYGIIDNISELAFCTFVGVHDRAVFYVCMHVCVILHIMYTSMCIHKCSIEHVSLNVTLLVTVTCALYFFHFDPMFTLLGSRLDWESILFMLVSCDCLGRQVAHPGCFRGRYFKFSFVFFCNGFPYY